MNGERKLPEWVAVGAEVVMTRNGRPYATGTITRVTASSAFVGSNRFVGIFGGWAYNSSGHKTQRVMISERLQAYGYAGDSWYSSHAINAQSAEGKLLIAKDARESQLRTLQAGWQTFIKKPTAAQASDLAKLLTKWADSNAD